MDDQTAKTRRIAEQNDRFRQIMGWMTLRGRKIVTPGIFALPAYVQQEILDKVQSFTAFTPDNNPYDERDFGVIEVAEAGKVFWKIDYYADGQVEYGSEDPSDPAKTYRVLTVMLASEY